MYGTKKNASPGFSGFGFLIKETQLGNVFWELQPHIVSLASWHYKWSNPITSTGMEKPNGITLVLTCIKQLIKMHVLTTSILNF